MRRLAITLVCLLTFSWVAGGPLAQTRQGCNGKVRPSKSVSDPTVTGPIEGGIRTGQPYGTTMVPLKKGWIEREFFIEGTARTYTTVTESEAPFKTRILVRRPT